MDGLHKAHTAAATTRGIVTCLARELSVSRLQGVINLAVLLVCANDDCDMNIAGLRDLTRLQSSLDAGK